MVSSHAKKFALAALVVVALVAVAGCGAKEEPRQTPKVSPPAVGKAGELRAGVDLSTPPFAGTDLGQKAGIDVDVAAALADKLALTVTYVDVAPSEAATALAEGDVDVVLSVPVSGADLSRVTPAGTYLTDAPAAFIATEGTASVEPSITIASLPVKKIAAQTASAAYWLVSSEYGTDGIEQFDSLREALESVDAGESRVAIGDALVGAYIARDIPSIKYAGQLADATPLSVAVAVENTTLADAVRSALDELAADGVLESVRKKWVGDLPELTTKAE